MRAKIIYGLILALALVACVTGEKTAGVDEFPNSIYARVNENLDAGKKSENINPVPGLADSLLDKPGFNVGVAKVAAANVVAAKGAAAKGVAAKISAASNWAATSGPMAGLAKGTADSSGCNGGIITVTDSVQSTLRVIVNILSYCVDEKLTDTVSNTKTIIRGKTITSYIGGRVDTAEFTDADGDGILNSVAGKNSKASFVFSSLEKGVFTKTMLVLGPGPDNDFATESDNLIYSASWFKLLGLDTLGSASYADADSDGVAVDNGKASLVDLEFYEKGPSKDHPDAVWSRSKLRLVVRYQVAAQEVKRVHFETMNKAGRKDIGEVLNLSGKPDFDMQDTVKAHFLSVGTSTRDSLDTMDVVLTMKLGKDFNRKDDDSVYAMEVRTRKKLGDERRSTFTFISDKPIPSGRDPQTGTLSMSMEYQDGTTLVLEGEITSVTLEVTVKNRMGARQHIIWDRQGRGISLEDLK